MVEQGFYIGNRNWQVTVFYDVQTPEDLNKVGGYLYSVGCPDEWVKDAMEVMSKPNQGYTFTIPPSHQTVMLMGHATSPEQMFDTILHEVKHLAEHVGEYYGLDPKSELSAYLQGEVGRQMWPAAAMVLCPKCHGGEK